MQVTKLFKRDLQNILNEYIDFIATECNGVYFDIQKNKLKKISKELELKINFSS